MAMNFPRDIRIILMRHRYAAIAMTALFMLGACSEIPVDEDTANVIRRQIDTLVKHDTTVDIDTFEVHVIDTVRDTVRIDRTEPLVIEGKIHRIKGGNVVGSIPIVIDNQTRLITEITSTNVLKVIRLKLIARVTQAYDPNEWGVPPSWIYLVIDRLELQNGTGARTLEADPRRDGVTGLAILPRPPFNLEWLATSPDAIGKFEVTGLTNDGSGRWINAYVKAEFTAHNARIDSLSLRFKY
jgi:hypothetical protein